jgi:hypothetical protein
VSPRARFPTPGRAARAHDSKAKPHLPSHFDIYVRSLVAEMVMQLVSMSPQTKANL